MSELIRALQIWSLDIGEFTENNCNVPSHVECRDIMCTECPMYFNDQHPNLTTNVLGEYLERIN